MDLRIFLLGRFEVLRDDVPIPADAWRRRRPADLLKLIALSAGRALSRAEAVSLLWPDKDPASGANNLHRALYDLRQILGGRHVDIERGVIQLAAGAWIDVEAFESAAASGTPGALESAVSLYRGDLSPEDLESGWLAARRALLRRRFAEAALPLARALAERGDTAGATALLRRALEVAPDDEAAHLALMRLHAESGRRADALRQYDACELALREARREGPGPELLALRQAIQSGEVGPRRSHLPWDGLRRASRRLLGAPEPPPLHGRASTLLLFQSLVEQGQGTLVLLGERGVGKTRLAVEGARIAQERGAVVLAGVCDPARREPFGPFADAWADYQRATPLPGGGPFARHAPVEGPEREKLRLLEAVRRSLTEIGAGRPVYLLLEDIHQADESSLNLLHFLARTSHASRLMIVATCREDAVRSGAPIQMLLAHLDCERLGRGIRVQRLDRAATAALVADVLGGPPAGELAAQIYRITDGSPFYAEEVALAWRESGQLSTPLDPAAAVRARVARLGPRAEQLLSAAAVVGQRFDFEVLRPVARLSAHEAVAALDACTDARLVQEDGEGYHFHHSLVREALYASLPTPRRVELHRAVADALEARAAATPGGLEEAAELLAFHRRAGDQPERALPHLVAAGRRAFARAGLREALDCLSVARDLLQPAGVSEALRREVLTELGEVQRAVADLPGLSRTLAEVGEVAGADTPELAGRVRRWEALALACAGDAWGAAERLEADAELPVDLYLARWEAELLDGAPHEAVEASVARMHERALRLDAHDALALARSMEGALAVEEGRFDLAEPALRDAAALHRAAGSALGEAWSLERLGVLLTARGRLEEGMGALTDGVLVAERASLQLHALTRLHASLARNRIAAGAFYAAEDALREASECAARHGACVICDAVLRPEAVRLALARSLPGAAEDEAAQLAFLAESRRGRVLGPIAAAARARTLLARGEAAAAREAFAAAASGYRAVGALYEAARATALGARAARAAGVPEEEARRLEALAQETLAGMGAPRLED
ncbi:MAG TPA: AAA family ATPase [Anaeromyxobacteraceae bacterium]|jgi:DNA-binding SARP family transcriptional activator|nr:AAA family ATPase [Anaeromyxobacteraceae bacterium]